MLLQMTLFCSFFGWVALWRRQWHPTPVLLPGKSHGWRSLVGCSPWGRWGSDMTERLHFHFSLSCIGEGNGNPLQCSCLENPRDRGAWGVAIYGVAQSRIWLKRLSNSMDNIISIHIIGVSKEQKREKIVNCIWWNYGWKLTKPDDSTEISQGTK